VICGYIVNLGQSSGKPPFPRNQTAWFAGLFHAHAILKMNTGYSESWRRCQMKLESIEMDSYMVLKLSH
jgi:hypothetical protein